MMLSRNPCEDPSLRPPPTMPTAVNPLCHTLAHETLSLPRRGGVIIDPHAHSLGRHACRADGHLSGPSATKDRMRASFYSASPVQALLRFFSPTAPPSARCCPRVSFI
ncbi:hypothetical protein B0H19DRAFT_1152337 [Mycena capillaripes]|nr:hypothetical protein B0H19DRAFT_1152337 [Mycena capillaripes]